MTVRGGARTRLVGGALVALATATVLTACAGQPGAAAVVDGTSIPASDVTTAYAELSPYFSGTSANVLGVLVEEPTIVQLAAEQGVAVSDADAEAFLQTLDPTKEVTYSDASVAIARYSIAASNLAALPDAADVNKELQKRISELDLDVNPRFGTADKLNNITAPTSPAWVIQPTTPPPLPDGTTTNPDGSPTSTASPSPSASS